MRSPVAGANDDRSEIVNRDLATFVAEKLLELDAKQFEHVLLTRKIEIRGQDAVDQQLVSALTLPCAAQGPLCTRALFVPVGAGTACGFT